MWGVEMINVSEAVKRLFSNDNKIACQSCKDLETESEKSNQVYPYFDTFSKMIENRNSYIRTRGLLLIAANAKWDIDCKIDEIIDKYLQHIIDEKPITSRQCIKVLPKMAHDKPDLREDIITALMKADTTVYTDSMQPLVYKDITAAIKKINFGVSG